MSLHGGTANKDKERWQKKDNLPRVKQSLSSVTSIRYTPASDRDTSHSPGPHNLTAQAVGRLAPDIEPGESVAIFFSS